MSALKIVGVKKKGTEQVSFPAKIDSDLVDEFKALEVRFAKEAPDYALSRNSIVENALRTFIKTATAALDKENGKSKTAPEPA